MRKQRAATATGTVLFDGSVLVSGEDRYGHNRIHEKNLNGFPFPKVDTDGR